jgi:16S rRNA (guanine527-N7)-methyltransferase
MQLGVPLGPQSLGLAEAYLDLLERWGAVYNLTAIRHRSAMRVHHLLDSLALVPVLLGTRRPGSPSVLLDVGSGAGLPGVVVSIALPEWTVICVDSVGKKAGFVQQVAAELGLRNLRAVHSRIEQLGGVAVWQRAAPSGAGVITSRAFGSLAALVAATESCLARDGVWLAMKGQSPAGELAELQQVAVTARPSFPALAPAKVWPAVVPGLYAERCIVELRRSA